MSNVAGPQDSAPADAPSETPAERASFVERLSDGLAGVVGAIVGSQRKPPRRLKSFLNGTWLGHPLHPAITDVPIGVWLLAAVFDVIWLAMPDASVWAARAAAGAIIVGII